MPDHPLNDAVRAWGELLGSIAWPVVVLIVIWRHRDAFSGLLLRLREIGRGGVKLDPHQGQQEPPTVTETLKALPEQPASASQAVSVANQVPLAPALERIRTPIVIAAEQQVLQLPGFGSASPLTPREQMLATVAGALLVASRFERIDGEIWQGQLKLLEFLNTQPTGAIDREILRALFFDPAVRRDPDWYRFTNYMRFVGFLVSAGLIRQSEDDLLITDFGREYLIWRVKQGRRPKVIG